MCKKRVKSAAPADFLAGRPDLRYSGRTIPDSEGKYGVAIVGLSFGAEFIPIYQAYPFTRLAAICQRTREKLDFVGDTWGVE